MCIRDYQRKFLNTLPGLNTEASTYQYRKTHCHLNVRSYQIHGNMIVKLIPTTQ